MADNGIINTIGVDLPDTEISVKDAFGLETDMVVPGFSKRTEYAPEIDESYCFDHDTTIAILASLHIAEN